MTTEIETPTPTRMFETIERTHRAAYLMEMACSLKSWAVCWGNDEHDVDEYRLHCEGCGLIMGLHIPAAYCPACGRALTMRETHEEALPDHVDKTMLTKDA